MAQLQSSASSSSDLELRTLRSGGSFNIFSPKASTFVLDQQRAIKFAVVVILSLTCWLSTGSTNVPDADGGPQWAQQRAVLAITVLMAGLWISGVTHMAVVSVLPVVLYPLFGVAPGKVVAGKFFSDTVFMLLGSVFLAIALEETGGHKRLALKFLSSAPSSPRAVLGSFMLVSALFSMVMSNTATCAVMTPMALAVYDELSSKSVDEEAQTTSCEQSPGAATGPNLRPFFTRVFLAIAYSCTLGGITTKMGTGTNLAFVAAYESLVGGKVGFLDWLLLAAPISLSMLAVCWLLMSFSWGGTQLPPDYVIPTEILGQTYVSLGPATRDQKVVLGSVIATLILWISEPKGWLPGLEMITDATSVMGVTLLLFFVPSSEARGGTLLDWKCISTRIPFDLLLLVGVGGVISFAFQTTGLSQRIGNNLDSLHDVPAPCIALMCMTVTTALTAVTSDVATANILLPIAKTLADSIKVDPLLLMIPVTFASSMAFVLPISTPPNAIALGTSFVSLRDFLKHGSSLVVVGLFVIEVVCFTFGLKAFGAEM